MKRVLRPGGVLLLLEHVRSPHGLVRAMQRAVELVTIPLEGDRLLREPLDLLAQKSFALDEVERSKLGIVERVRAIKR